VTVRIVSEHLTSQACGKCFNLKKIKGKTYECDECKTTIDRDINGARNIYILELCKILLHIIKMLNEIN